MDTKNLWSCLSTLRVFCILCKWRFKKRLYAKEGLGSDGPGIGPNILIAVTGSVASVKIPELVLHFRRLSPCCRIRIISTVAGKRMLSKCKGYDSEAWGKFCALNLEVLDDSDEW